MKNKKWLSLLTAAAMSASCLAGLSISVSAETYTYMPDAEGEVTAGTKLLDNSDIVVYTTNTVTAAANTDSNFDTATYSYNLPFRGNGTVSKHLDDMTGNNKDAYTNIVAEPVNDGVFTAYIGVNADKTLRIWDNTDNKELTNVKTNAKAVTPISATLTATHQYLIYTSGTSGCLEKVSYEVADPTPTPAPEYTTIYQFGESNGADTINIGEGSTGSVSPTTADEDANAPDIAVDSTNNGKLNNDGRGDTWAQLNANTVLTLPDVPIGTKLTFNMYGSTGLTIDGTEYTNGSTYTATKNGDVVMTCTTGGYISTITVVGQAFGTIADEPTPTPNAGDYIDDFAFSFGGSNSTELTSATQGTYYLDKDGKLGTAAANNIVTASNVKYYNDHGLSVGNGSTFSFRAQGPFKLIVGTCTYGSGAGYLKATSVEDSSKVYTSDSKAFNGIACYKSNANNVINYYYTGNDIVDVVYTVTAGGYFPFLGKTSIVVDDISGDLVNSDGLNEGTLTFTGQTSGEVFTASINNGTYSVALPEGETYDVSLSDCAYVLSGSVTYTAEGSSTSADLNCEKAQPQTVTGTITNAPSEAFTLTFTAANDSSYTKTIELEANATSLPENFVLDPDVYTVSSSVGTLSPLSLEKLTITNSAVEKNLYYPETVAPATKNTLTVGTHADDDYATISDALSALSAGKHTSPTIILHSGETYREQVVVNIANTTFKTDGEEKATITWYYGIGYTYYSLGSDGYYDKDRAMTRNSKNFRDPDRWGATVRVRAENFKADNINFVNSFNQEYTEEEVIDGVEPNLAQSIRVDRIAQTVAADSKTATERGAAIALDGKNAQLYNCSFVGSQDTFYTGQNAYVKNCDITGNTDYIFGGGNVVFDNCNLIWGGYSDSSVGGYLTANKPSAAGIYYIFRNCTVKNADVEGRNYAGGALGRDWGGKDAGVYFFNTVFADGGNTKLSWTDMGGAVKTGEANLHIYDFDPSVNANYQTTGSTGANVNGLLTFDEAAALYEGVNSRLGFTPEQLANAETSSALAKSTVDDDTVYGVVTTITAGSDITISGVKWTVVDTTEDKVYTLTSEDAINQTGNGVSGDAFPAVTGGTVTVTMMFHAAPGEETVENGFVTANSRYNVLSEIN
jgi:pectin methylesterase-like acyl-CoA thioesterase